MAMHTIASARLDILQPMSRDWGLEDLEGCEHFFSKSNSLASSTQYASIFHHCQAISEYAMYTDKFDTYQNLGMSHPISFIHSNAHFTA